MKDSLQPLPRADSQIGRKVLLELARRRTPLAALEVMHDEVGDIFQVTLPSFDPVVLVGPERNRYLLVTDRHKFNWRVEADPVARLLRRGVLVVDGEEHDHLRSIMEPSLQRGHVYGYLEQMCHYTDEIIGRWADGRVVDMLVEMRRVALLIFVGTLFQVEFGQDLDRLWEPILRSIDYISPGLWVIWPGIPRPFYKKPIQELDAYLYEVIKRRRAIQDKNGGWLDQLIASGLSDDLIRDQMLTMLIAGHDTSTALLAWTLYLLGRNPKTLQAVQQEVDSIVGGERPRVDQLKDLRLMGQVIDESLRLYPPIHIGNRVTSADVDALGYGIPRDQRVMYSIYLSHRDSAIWPEANRFHPERFDRTASRGVPAFAYVPFGGGPRNCIGAAFAQVESKIILARIFQSYNLELVSDKVKAHMGATLEPRPGVYMRVRRRR